MRAEDLTHRVEQHYSSTNEPLLLSELGADLARAGLWPPPGETRPLADVIEDLAANLRLVRDPRVKAYVVVVPADKEDLAKAAIERRHGRRLLRSLPRAVLLAFCVNAPPGVDVYLRIDPPPPRYEIGTKPDDPGFLLVDAEFRNPGLYVDDAGKLESDVAEHLGEGIQKWARKYDVALDRFLEPDKASHLSPSAASEERFLNALERLYAAQSPEFVRRLVVPLDIALALNRLP